MNDFSNVRSQILGRLNELSVTGRCPLCAQQKWTLAEGLIWIPLQEDFFGVSTGGPGLPMVALVCANCGNTQFINLITIGLESLVRALSIQPPTTATLSENMSHEQPEPSALVQPETAESRVTFRSMP